MEAKQAAPCEHQLAAAAHFGGDGVLDSSNQRQLPPGQRGSKYCPECKIETRRDTIYKWKVLVALVIPNIMASMDMTIIATALPTIASHFGMCTVLCHKASSLLTGLRSCARAIQLDRDRLHPGVNIFDPAVRAGC